VQSTSARGFSFFEPKNRALINVLQTNIQKQSKKTQLNIIKQVASNTE